MKSVMTHQFSQIPRADIPRSMFNRSHGYKSTFDAGYLIPFYVDEVLPGDTFTLKASIFARLATPIVPIMDNLYLETFFFFVPNRLVWDNWQRFNGEQDNPGDSTDYLVPQIAIPNAVDSNGELQNFIRVADYFGLPMQPAQGTSYTYNVNALPFRAYNLIWNEWFRDQNLQDSVPVPKGDGPDNLSTAGTNLLRRGKRHDYFTSCLPWPQKGEGVELPLGATAEVLIPSSSLNLTVRANGTPTFNSGGATNQPLTAFNSGENAYVTAIRHGSSQSGALTWNNPALKATGSIGNLVGTADLSGATAVTINSFRQAFQIQRLMERDARGGTRYTEILRSHFGVVSPDSRLQRPEYLGGSHTPIHINQVPQTSSTDSTSPQGNLAAFGVASDNFHGFTKSFVEHGFVIGLLNVRADLTYQQGINRMWSRKTRFDYYWPALAHLGEQAVLNKEIYVSGTSADEEVFGYQERFAEYRYYPSLITGAFRSTRAQPLDVWHLSQKFDSMPQLGPDFIQDDPPIDRVIAVPSEPHFLLDAFFDLKCARPMPLYSVPGLIDHF